MAQSLARGASPPFPRSILPLTRPPLLPCRAAGERPRRAAAPVRRAARPPPFPAVQLAGEARRHLLLPVRTSPGRSGPASAVPPFAPGERRPACLDLARGRLPVGPTCRPLASGCGRIRVRLAV